MKEGLLKIYNFLTRLFRRRRYLLFDGQNSCVYVPKGMYKYLQKELVKGLRNGRTKENSLRFVWARLGDGSAEHGRLRPAHRESGNGGFLLLVNPNVEMARTHGLTWTEIDRGHGTPAHGKPLGGLGGVGSLDGVKKRMVTIPCPYIQQILWGLRLPEDYRGDVEVRLSQGMAENGMLMGFEVTRPQKGRAREAENPLFRRGQRCRGELRI